MFTFSADLTAVLQFIDFGAYPFIALILNAVNETFIKLLFDNFPVSEVDKNVMRYSLRTKDHHTTDFL